MVFDPRVVAAAPWSLSKANVLTSCTAQYQFKYVAKAPEGRKSTQSRVGVTAHAVQEYALQHAPTYEDLQRYTRGRIETDELTHDEAVEVTAKLSGVVDFSRRIADLKSRYGVRREYIEHKLAMTADWAPAGFFAKEVLLRGVIDYGMETDAGILLLVDHKSGKRKPVAQHAPQFYTYMDLALVNFPEVDGVQSAINYFGNGDLDWFPRFDGSSGAWTRRDIATYAGPWLEQFLNRLTKRLTLITDGQPEPETGWQCEFCGYVDRCAPGTAHADERRAKRAARGA